MNNSVKAMEWHRKKLRLGMRHGHHCDKSTIVLSCRVDNSIGYSVLRLNRRGISTEEIPIAIAYIPFAITLLIPPGLGKRINFMALMTGFFGQR